jgi:hypothetical protein
MSLFDCPRVGRKSGCGIIDPDPGVVSPIEVKRVMILFGSVSTFLLRDYLAAIVDNALRHFLHRHLKTNEIRHLTAPSSTLKIRLISIQSSYLKEMRAHHSMPCRSRRDTPPLSRPLAIRFQTGTGRSRHWLLTE